MSSSLRWRTFATFVVAVWAIYVVLPNFMKSTEKKWWVSDQKLKYGLDIQGGLHLVLGADTRSVMKQQTLRDGVQIAKNLETEGLAGVKVEPQGENGLSLQITLADAGQNEKAKAYMEKNYRNLLMSENNGARLVYTISDGFVRQIENNAVDQAIETIRNRIDEFGVSEPSITKVGSDRILIQLPLRDVADVNRAKGLISRTARLEFKMVSAAVEREKLLSLIEAAQKEAQLDLKTLTYSQYVEKLNAALRGKLPENTEVRFARDERVKSIEDGKVAYLLETKDTLGGELLESAGVAFGEYGEPEVAIAFNPEGSQRFEQLTGANINRQMAIVLDEVVYSAPSIKNKIPGGRAVITLGRGDRDSAMEEAKTISMALSSGALPVRLEQLEERTVGPTLGADSIAKGIKATWIGGLFIFIFMLYYYRTMGMIANLALGMNVLLILAVLTALDATLTLPGIAGLALTMGMAVDANVIINERIKDELAKGSGMLSAVKIGYSKAMSAIWDGNITTIGVCVILFYFGTGPIRGFAISLIIGLLASMLTAIFMTRVIVDTLMIKFNWNYIRIGFDQKFAAFQQRRG